MGGCIQQLNTLKMQQSVFVKVKLLLGLALILPMWMCMSFMCVCLCGAQYADFFSCISGGWIRAASFRSLSHLQITEFRSSAICVRTDYWRVVYRLAFCSVRSRILVFLDVYTCSSNDNLKGNSRAQTLLNSAALHELPEGGWFWSCCLHPPLFYWTAAAGWPQTDIQANPGFRQISDTSYCTAFKARFAFFYVVTDAASGEKKNCCICPCAAERGSLCFQLQMGVKRNILQTKTFLFVDGLKGHFRYLTAGSFLFALFISFFFFFLVSLAVAVCSIPADSHFCLHVFLPSQSEDFSPFFCLFWNV